MIRAVTFDYWDTLYDGAATPERIAFRRAALRRLVEELGHRADAKELDRLYDASGVEAERWWREEQRGYTTADRLRWVLDELGLSAPDGCAPLRRAVAAVDEALDRWPPPLLPGAAAFVRLLSAHVPLAIVSDTGFASGAAQDRLLARDDLRAHFAATVYSMDVGHCKPRREPFAAAVAALGVAPSEVLHVGDLERTDVRGALDAGLRAVRLDVVTANGPSAAEYVAESFEALEEYLLDTIPRPQPASAAGD